MQACTLRYFTSRTQVKYRPILLFTWYTPALYFLQMWSDLLATPKVQKYVGSPRETNYYHNRGVPSNRPIPHKLIGWANYFLLKCWGKNHDVMLPFKH